MHYLILTKHTAEPALRHCLVFQSTDTQRLQALASDLYSSLDGHLSLDSELTLDVVPGPTWAEALALVADLHLAYEANNY